MRDVSRFPVGQNVYQTSRSRDQDLRETVRESVMGLTGWYSEVRDFANDGVDQYEYVKMLRILYSRQK